MASLRTTAQQVLEEARDGIAWIALYKEGRGWGAACFWPDIDRGGKFTFDPDDVQELEAILGTDPEAIFVNGYYSNLGPIDGMTRESLSSALRWQYEEHFNQLADTALTAAPQNTLPTPYAPSIEEAGATQQEGAAVMRKMKKINGYLVVRFNDREKQTYPALGSFGVIDAEAYTGNLYLDREVMEYMDADTIEVAVEQARDLDAEEDFTDEPPTYTLIVEDGDHTTETEIAPQLLIKGWEQQLKTQIKSPHYKDIDPRTAAHELYGYKAALHDLGLIDRDARAVDPDHFAPGMMEQPLPRDSEELLAHICDKVCKHPHQAESQGKLDTACAMCAVGRLASETDDRGLRIVKKAKERLDGLIQGIAETQLATKAEALKCEAQAYLEALTTTKTLTEREVAVYGAAINEAVKGRPEPPARETFENLDPGMKNGLTTRKVYSLGLALAEECPPNDCTVYLNIFNMARDLDAVLDELDASSHPAQVLRRDLRQQLTELREMYRKNYAVQRFKEGLQK